MSCGVETIRVSDEQGRFTEKPVEEYIGGLVEPIVNELFNDADFTAGLWDQEAFDEAQKAAFGFNCEFPGPPRDSLNTAIAEEFADLIGGEWDETARTTETVTITDPDSGASVDVERITAITFAKTIGVDTYSFTLNINGWS